MSIYQRIAEIGPKYMSKKTLFKYGFNLAPMYRRSTARIISVSDDLMTVEVKLPISYKNRNYVGTIFGGSMFAAVDPVPMVQLINILDGDYVVWDQSAEIIFKRPAREDLYARFAFTADEVDAIKTQVLRDKEMEVEKMTELTSEDGTKVFSTVRKTLYVADKAHYRSKRR